MCIYFIVKAACTGKALRSQKKHLLQQSNEIKYIECDEANVTVIKHQRFSVCLSTNDHL